MKLRSMVEQPEGNNTAPVGDSIFFLGTCDFEGAPVGDSIFFRTCDLRGLQLGTLFFFGTCDFEGGSS